MGDKNKRKILYLKVLQHSVYAVALFVLVLLLIIQVSWKIEIRVVISEARGLLENQHVVAINNLA